MIGLVLLTVGLLIAKVIFVIPILGSVLLIYAYTSLYLLVVLEMGLFISNFTDTQQQAMFISWFFIVIFILMSGLFTPIESMPKWALYLTELNPVAYFVEIMRLIMLKGSSFADTLEIFEKNPNLCCNHECFSGLELSEKELMSNLNLTHSLG